MAQKIKVILIDDLDGTDATETIQFAIDGVSYEIDLNDKHANEFRADLERWIKAGRRVSGRRSRKAAAPRAAGQSAATSDAAKVRQWARENGYEVSARGRVPAEIRDAYNQRAR